MDITTLLAHALEQNNAGKLALVIVTNDGKHHRIENLEFEPHAERVLVSVKAIDEIPFIEQSWINVDSPEFEDVKDFVEIRMVLLSGQADTGYFTDDEIMNASGCLGYSLKEHLRGEELSQPKVRHNADHHVIIDFDYDSADRRNGDADFDLTFHRAAEYIREGSPIRTTNRAGRNTKGTRLVEGIGTDVDIEFYAR